MIAIATLRKRENELMKLITTNLRRFARKGARTHLREAEGQDLLRVDARQRRHSYKTWKDGDDELRKKESMKGLNRGRRSGEHLHRRPVELVPGTVNSGGQDNIDNPGSSATHARTDCGSIPTLYHTRLGITSIVQGIEHEISAFSFSHTI